MRVSGFNGHYDFVLGAGAKAKSVTNNLPILSVLAKRFYYLFFQNLDPLKPLGKTKLL